VITPPESTYARPELSRNDFVLAHPGDLPHLRLRLRCATAGSWAHTGCGHGPGGTRAQKRQAQGSLGPTDTRQRTVVPWDPTRGHECRRRVAGSIPSAQHQRRTPPSKGRGEFSRRVRGSLRPQWRKVVLCLRLERKANSGTLPLGMTARERRRMLGGPRIGAIRAVDSRPE
jgi:hypothetical protein